LVIILSIGFLCKNWTVRFGKPDDLIFPENSYICLFDLFLLQLLFYLVSTVS
jgi:hypothetical protein